MKKETPIDRTTSIKQSYKEIHKENKQTKYNNKALKIVILDKDNNRYISFIHLDY